MNIKEDADPPLSASQKLEFEPSKGYEQMLQKLEEEVRGHIRIEQQLKLHIDNLQAKSEEDEKSIMDLKAKIKEKNQKYEDLDSKYKELSAKYNKLEQKLEIYEKSSGLNSGLPLDSFQTQSNIGAEEKLANFHNDIGVFKKTSELAQRVFF